MTVLFCDMVGSTSFAERLDPEAVRRVMSRWFDAATEVLDRHGGTVEKYIGDAVMAVFGIPTVREDDALRAVRAALDIQEAVRRLNVELESGIGVRMAVRIGVNTGEVMAGDPSAGQSFASGDPVNLAARLEQAAGPDEVLIGETTERLVRHAAELEAQEALELKGKSAPVMAWRVLSIDRTAPGRRLGGPFVGRERELEQLEAGFRAAIEGGECRMVTVLGPAGIGKSRLAAEGVRRVAADASTVQGRCLPYGTATFWPLREIVARAAGIAEEELTDEEAQARIAGLVDGGAEATTVAAHVAGAVGMCRACSSHPEEVFWAVRRLLESLARERPLVVLFDDIQWAEAMLLDLIEYVAGFTTGAPVVLCCLARPALLERRADWASGHPNAMTIELRPMRPAESRRLVGTFLGAELPKPVAERVIAAAEGNPFYVEEVLRMLVDDHVLERTNGSWTVTGDLRALTIPPTIQAIIASRLDALPAPERALIEQAAIIGKEFGWATLAAVTPSEARGELAGNLQALVRKGLIHPGTATVADAFTFGHIMIRDIAYEGMPKSTRADSHVRLADSLEAPGGAAGNLDEIVGFHLEQAYGLRREVALGGDLVTLAQRASQHLARAGRRAYGRGDLPAAVDLLTRADRLLEPDDAERLALVPKLADALINGGDPAGAEKYLAQALDDATRAGDPAAEAGARLLRLYARSFTHPEEGLGELTREATRAREVFGRLGDHAGLARAENAIAVAHLSACRWMAAADARRREIEHARRAGEKGLELRAQSALAYAVLFGPTPVDEALTAVAEIREQTSGYPSAEGAIAGILGLLTAMRGEFDRARELHRSSAELLSDLGPALPVGEAALNAGESELLAGDPAAAEAHLRPALEALEKAGETAIMASVAVVLADAVYLQGRVDDAEALVRDCEPIAADDDVAVQAGLRGTRAKVLVTRGEAAEAERLARESVQLAAGTDDLNLRGGTLLALGEVLTAAGHAQAGAEATAAALELYRQKGNLPAADRALAAVDRQRLRSPMR